MKASLVSGAARSIRQIRVPPQQGMSNSHSGKSSDEKNYETKIVILSGMCVDITDFLLLYAFDETFHF